MHKSRKNMVAGSRIMWSFCTVANKLPFTVAEVIYSSKFLELSYDSEFLCSGWKIKHEFLIAGWKPAFHMESLYIMTEKNSAMIPDTSNLVIFWILCWTEHKDYHTVYEN